MTMKVIEAKRLKRFLPKTWKGNQIFVLSSSDSVLMKQMAPVKRSDLRERLLKAGKKVTKNDLAEAIRATRT